eukprot:CAMPEP_0172042754 /NCGR_PEP_ID=MMETSP1041-20130122/25873_1 /TAXON_ID=464988 /ORGANISM="Hemiselmis andersenii, Strain CCMP439" /LENGTH=150 /DNA_ID=CAMNT_0012701085 /DNA_START=35 /DNA_END=490 /DNA_ORIENTATION=+
MGDPKGGICSLGSEELLRDSPARPPLDEGGETSWKPPCPCHVERRPMPLSSMDPIESEEPLDLVRDRKDEIALVGDGKNEEAPVFRGEACGPLRTVADFIFRLLNIDDATTFSWNLRKPAKSIVSVWMRSNPAETAVCAILLSSWYSLAG